MKIYLHLADPGLILSNLSIRVYSGGSLPALIDGSGLTLTPLLSTPSTYILEGIPTPGPLGTTITLESPSGVYHSYRLGVAETQPLNVIIPIREVVSDPVDTLQIKLFRDGVTDTDSFSVDQLALDGEYNVSGWNITPLNESWSVRWEYNGLVYAHSWIGESIVGPGTFYLWILAAQCPIDISPDAQGRAVFSFNYSGEALGPSINVEKEMAQLLVNAGLGVRGSTIYVGRLVTLPDIDPRAESDSSYDIPFTQIINTGGSGTESSHDGITNELLSFQVLVRAVAYDIARAKAFAVWRTLNNKYNITVAAA